MHSAVEFVESHIKQDWETMLHFFNILKDEAHSCKHVPIWTFFLKSGISIKFLKAYFFLQKW